MSKVTMFLATLAVLSFAVVLTGCSSDSCCDSATSAGSAQPPADNDADHDHDADHNHSADHDHDAADHDDVDHDAADHDHADDAAGAIADPKKDEMLAGLSAEDRAAVEKQRTCPVSGGLLWGMGKPYKVSVTGSDGQERAVFLCCQGCEDAIKKEPDKYLVKLEK
ncbi:MAG: hypothetical protein A2V70_15815 [Planctomycetes bacterium RBG_13_63_9]|nr:MAG: hypothetical protein A2V70_15815 [Planctomycetes bacterium RBG_13_63_9]